MSRTKKAIIKLTGSSLAMFIILVIIGSVVVDHSNPPVTYNGIKWDSPQTEDMMRHACYNCHSNETVWPWYSYIAPVAFLVSKDVQEGRSTLNFSTGQGQMEPRNLARQIQKGKMPPPIYLIMHPDANLTDQQKQDLIAGIHASTFR